MFSVFEVFALFSCISLISLERRRGNRAGLSPTHTLVCVKFGGGINRNLEEKVSGEIRNSKRLCKNDSLTKIRNIFEEEGETNVLWLCVSQLRNSRNLPVNIRVVISSEK